MKNEHNAYHGNNAGRAISLTRDLVAMVDDDAAYDWLAQFRWAALATNRDGVFYAVRSSIYTMRGPHRETIYMHREIMEVILGYRLDPSEEVDHRDGDGLNNRTDNLRVATKSQNRANQQHPRIGPSGFRGVSWQAANSKWRARSRFNGKETLFGYFDTAIEAAEAYDKAVLEFHGEFAATNKSLGLL